jgi:ABC-type uncharacterized transport system involved in gliding motility auxiliary subunit
MRRTFDKKWELRLVNASFVVLFLVAVGLLQWLSREYHLKVDLTQNSRHTLSAASVAAAERLAEPLTVTAYASQRGERRRVIGDLVARYQKHKPDIRLEFVDPDTAPEQARAAGVRHDGEMVLAYGDARERLTPMHLNEEQFTNALTRLGQRGERWIVFLSGHGERSPDREANFDLSLWAGELRKRGFKTRALALADHPQIPANTAALVIAGPRARLLPGEVKEIERFLEDGGNLLWLHDPGPLHGLERIAERLGVEFQPGVIVDPVSQAITGSATAIVVANYSAHPVVRDFGQAVLFPHAHGISLNAPQGWRGAVLMDTGPNAWSETGPLDDRMRFDKGKDVPGPLSLAVALTREREQREQRVAIVGDGDFLSNAFLGNVGNLDFGMSLINWLSRQDAYVSIPVKVARDRRLELSRGVQLAMAGGFLILLPLLLAASGAAIWLVRRKR